MMRAFALAGFAVVLSGHVLDRTTGQPLAGVRVRAGRAQAVTDRAGRYALRGLRTGAVAITLESDDVPAQHLTVRVGPGPTNRDLHACSTTLDYNCSGPTPAEDPGGGAS
jgi:protocatechuate 3,4-dioxygenase beta subunit